MNNSDDHPMLEPPQLDSEPEEEDDLVLLEDTEDRTNVIDLTENTPVKVPIQQLKQSSNDTYNDEGDTCPICLEMWADAGEHRLCAMKCGHLFGRNCIEMWLRDHKNCPSCKKRGLKRDLRNLYCNKVIALEESSVLDLKARLRKAEEAENELQTTVNQYLVHRGVLTAQVASLQQQLTDAQVQLNLQQFNTTASVNSSFNRNVLDLFNRLVRLKSVQISSEVGCRVMDYDAWLNAIVCSMKCPNAMFGSYGLAKLNISTFDMIGNMPLHAAPIRDVCFQSAGGSSLLLTASMDKQARIVDTRSPGPPRSYFPPPDARSSPLWSCCWGDPGAMGGSYTVYLGEQQGDIIELDLRRLNERVSTLKVDGEMSPVVALQALPPSAGDCLPRGGLIACRLSSLRVFERTTDGTYKLRTLSDPPQGPFMSMSFNRNGYTNRHLLLSSRPNSSYAFTRHLYGQFREDALGNLSLSPIHTFEGGLSASLLSRTSVTSQYACAYIESTRTISTWNLSTGRQLPNCHTMQQPVLDMAMFTADAVNRVLALDERKLNVFNMD